MKLAMSWRSTTEHLNVLPIPSQAKAKELIRGCLQAKDGLIALDTDKMMNLGGRSVSSRELRSISDASTVFNGIGNVNQKASSFRSRPRYKGAKCTFTLRTQRYACFALTSWS